MQSDWVGDVFDTKLRLEGLESISHTLLLEDMPRISCFEGNM